MILCCVIKREQEPKTVTWSALLWHAQRLTWSRSSRSSRECMAKLWRASFLWVDDFVMRTCEHKLLVGLGCQRSKGIAWPLRLFVWWQYWDLINECDYESEALPVSSQCINCSVVVMGSISHPRNFNFSDPRYHHMSMQNDSILLFDRETVQETTRRFCLPSLDLATDLHDQLLRMLVGLVMLLHAYNKVPLPSVISILPCVITSTHILNLSLVYNPCQYMSHFCCLHNIVCKRTDIFEKSTAQESNSVFTVQYLILLCTSFVFFFLSWEITVLCCRS